MGTIHPRLCLRIEWDAYQVLLQEAQAYNLLQDEVMAEKGYAAYIEMPHYDGPLEMAAGGVWRRVTQVIGPQQKQNATT